MDPGGKELLTMQRRRFLLTGGYAGSALGYQANETVHLGVIGAGGRARALLRALDKLPGVRVNAIADIWDASIAEARKLADPGAFITKHYPRLLERKDVDAVLIGSPDHWHVRMTVDACAAGKDVYVEKPLTHHPSEGPAVIEAQNRHRRVVQVGTQQRSMPHLIEAREIVRSGKLGRIHKVHMSWNRNQSRRPAARLQIDPASLEWTEFVGGARRQDFDAYRFRNWRWFWDFGGGIFTDLMVHWLDTVNWMLDLPLPATAASIGDNIGHQGLWETPDTVQTLLTYPRQSLQAYFEGTFVNARNAAMTELMGTEATLYIDRGRYEILPERREGGSPPPASTKILGEGPRGADFYSNPDGEAAHLANWLECIRTRRRPAVPAEEGVKAADGAHLANAALRSGAVAKQA